MASAKYFKKQPEAIKIFQQMDFALLDSPDYLKLQCEIRGVGKEDLFWTMLAGVRFDCVYDALLHFIEDIDFFDEFLDDSRLIRFIEEAWIGLQPAVNNLFWFTEVGKLMDKWNALSTSRGLAFGYRTNTANGYRAEGESTKLKFRLYDAISEKRSEQFKRYYDENIRPRMSEILDVEERDDNGMFQPLLQFFRMFKKKAATGDEKAKTMFEDMARQLVDCI